MDKAIRVPEPAAQGEATGDLVPVDREFEAEVLLRVALNNWGLSAGHPKLLYTSQMWGSGKTTFAKNFLRIVGADMMASGPILKSLLASKALPLPADTPDRCGLASMRSTQAGRWSVEIVRRIAGARLVYVDLQDGFPRDPTFEESVYHALFRSATGEEPKTRLARDPRGAVMDWRKALVAAGKPDHDGLWYLVFDEIGEFDERLSKYYSDLEGVEFVHTKFFTILRPFLTHRDVFVFCAGRSERLALASKSSPVEFLMLALSPLKRIHLSLVARTTHSQPGVLLGDEIGRRVNLEMLLDAIFATSIGIPRYVLHAFNGIVTYMRVSEAECKLSDVPINCQASKPKLKTKGFQALYRFLAFSALTGHKIVSSATVVTDEGSRPVLDAVASLDVFLEPAGDGLYKPIFPPCLIASLRSDPLNLCNMFGMLEMMHFLPPRTLDAGHTLTLVVALSISRALKGAKTLTDVPGLGFAEALKSIVVFPDNGRKFDLDYVASFAESDNITYFDQGKTIAHNFPASTGWPAALENLTRKFINVVGVPFDNNSKGPDLVVPISGKSEKVLSCVLEWAMKNKWSIDGLSWPEVQDEISKGIVAPRIQNVRLPIVLCVIATKHNASVQEAVKNRVECYGPGDWFSTASGPLRCGPSDSDKRERKAPVFSVPSNSHVVIFSKEAIAELIGQRALESLERGFSPEHLTTENLQKLAQFTLIDATDEIFETPKKQPGRPTKRARTAEDEEAPSPTGTLDFGPAPAARAAHPLFADPKTKIDLAWLQAVFPGKDPKKLELWLQRLLENEVDDVGTLAKQTKTDLKGIGIPLATAGTLAEQAALCPK